MELYLYFTLLYFTFTSKDLVFVTRLHLAVSEGYMKLLLALLIRLFSCWKETRNEEMELVIK